MLCLLDEKEEPMRAPLAAEGEGFEPPVPCGTAVFKTAVIDHSTILPIVECAALMANTFRTLAVCGGKGKEKVSSFRFQVESFFVFALFF